MVSLQFPSTCNTLSHSISTFVLRLTTHPPAELKQPTNPDSAAESSASSTHLESTLAPPHGLTTSNMMSANGALTPGASGLSQGPSSAPNSMMGGLNYGDTNYDFFDPQHWMLDGLLDFNYNFVPPLESA